MASEISPTVAEASTAVRIRGMTFAPDRAASSTPVRATFHGPGVALCAQSAQAFYLLRFERWIDALNRDRFFFFHFESIHADHDDSFLIDGLLILVGCVLNFVLHEAALDSFQHPAHHFDLSQIFSGALFDFVGQRLDVIRSRQRIDRLWSARFVGDHLLGAESDARCLFGG